MIDLLRAPPLRPGTAHPDLDRVLALVAAQARQAFPGGRGVAGFAAACAALYTACGAAVGLAYGRQAPGCAILLGADAAPALAEALTSITAQAGPAAAAMVAEAALRAARALPEADGFADWLRTLCLLARQAPTALGAVLLRTESLLAERGVAGFVAWVEAGLRATERAPERRLAYFRATATPAADAMPGGLAAVRGQLAAWLRAGWGLSPVLAEATPSADLPPPRRARFEPGQLVLPAAFDGSVGAASARLFRAAAAHVAAHLQHGPPGRFAIGSLKPAQIVLVSLIEDARVEHLAMQALPGLVRLWRPLHVAPATPGLASAAALMARLARALIDPAYRDDNAWVAKGVALFAAARSRIDDPAISRAIGGVLGNDIGQLRLQFDARIHLVEPVYRDDNQGLWDFPPSGPPGAAEMAARPDPAERQAPQDAALPAGHPDAGGAAKRSPAAAEIGVPVARYPEWDHLIARERPDWATLLEYHPPPGDGRRIEAMLAGDAALTRRVQRLVRSARIGRTARLRRQREGDQLDLDAAIAATIERRLGQIGDAPVHIRQVRQARDLSVLLLLDTSRSTGEIAAGIGRSVLDLEVHAAAMLAHAMAGMGDPFAMRAFCSDGRGDVRYYRIKDFTAPYDPAATRRLAGLTARFSTRIGTALRHAGAELAAQPTHRRLLLMITDGEPSDIDISDRRYLVEDARQAVHGLARSGIDTFCVGLQGAAQDRLRRVFGRNNVLQVDRIERLPERLAGLYVRMAG